ncbi:allantoate amidohydrolase [Brevibacillus nitrificans]|uniref:allantoate amidohydrolase n=1 Tax=Brevibacillus nitrificans TaxID=651560 RepID=UPI00286B4543|nr:allantoate amidohydrolase [Brevibacillus nitrificans]
MEALQKCIHAERMIGRIEALAQCSLPGRGVTRLSFTEQSEQAILLVAGWMQEAGMKVRRDAVNNLIGRYEGMDPDAPVLLIGSHLDSVAEAGKYDGILGVIAGIEVVHAIKESGTTTKYPIEVIGFCDEEGTRFHTTFLGSRAIAGTLREQDLEAQDHEGATVAEAMRAVGSDPEQYRRAARDPQTILGYLELHIEQGPVLEEMGQSCGAVAGIAGQSRYEFRVEGQAGHAGTVPVRLRRDALAGAAEMIQAVERIALKNESVVATVGKLAVLPGASNVIPGVVMGTLDVRSLHDDVKQSAILEMIEEFRQIAQRRGLVCHFQRVMDSPAVACTEPFVQIIETVMEERGMKPLRLVSGAGHDAMAVAAIADIGMIFVRCREGVSHHPDEYASPADILEGATVLMNAALRLTT